MRKYIIILMLLLASSVFAQEKNVEINNRIISVRSSTTRTVNIQMDKCLVVFRNEKIDQFVKLLETHISLLESASALKITEKVSESILMVDVDKMSYIKTSIVMGGGEPKIRMFISTQIAYDSIDLNVSEMRALLQAFREMNDVNKVNTNNIVELRKLVFETQTKFKN